MSDDDEFGGLAPTTPAVAVRLKKAPSKPIARIDSSAAGTGTGAGPSSKPKPRAVRKTVQAKPKPAHAQPIQVVSDTDLEVEVVPHFDFTRGDADEDEDGGDRDREDGEVEELPTPSRRGAGAVNGKLNANATTNANAKGKGKGKAKANGNARPPPQRASKKQAPEPMDVDAIEILDEQEYEEGNDMAVELAGAINAAGTGRNKRGAKNDSGLGGSKMAEKLRRAEDRMQALTAQLEAVFQVRETEAERLLKQLEAQYEAQLRAQERLIEEMQTQLKMKEPLMRSGNTAVLNLLTREAADAEMRNIQEDLARWKGVANERQRAIAERDVRIAELEQQEKETRFELNAEIERSKTLMAKALTRPPSAVRSGRAGGVDDPRHAEILKFYEDLTNLLVPTMKSHPGKYLGLDEWSLSCVYTLPEDEDTPSPKSLSFTLKLSWELPEGNHEERVTSKDQLVATAYYVPLGLENEPAEFVEQLDFLKAPFSFGRDQLPLFLRTMYGKMNECKEEGSGEEDGEEEG
ncbi:hypothetical protein H0H81_007176 [Sphagnurus paluster]|uniref:Monopolin complex subunit Csm1/Pcs1 C-terminal domain-containing protein n=1 Tax=Sphagnurus paluster TaxID=117069 RepID=A0A9P7GQG5_9AGAR|nr:hypothetical protein H0H81_007176 [Sphagnurus paluster]